MTIERSILDAAARLRRQSEPHLVATVVRVHGSVYRRPGARMLLTQFRWITGSGSGGCLDGDIASEGWWRTRDGEPIIVTYDSAMSEHPDDDDIRSAFGLGCDGVIEVMLERGNVPGRIDPLEIAERCMRTQRRGAVVTVIASRVDGVKLGARVALHTGSEPTCDVGDERVRTAMIADAHAAIASGLSNHRVYSSDRGNVEVFVEAILPPPRLFLFGAGHDAVPVAQLARELGWDVSVCTRQPRIATRERFSRVSDELLVGTPAELAARIDECDTPVAVVMSHHNDSDRTNLGMLIATRARYIGVVGPRTRTTRMLNELYLVAQDDPRLHAPAGLELGAETPHEIALAIVSEIQAVLRRSAATTVRPGALHPELPRISDAVAALTVVS